MSKVFRVRRIEDYFRQIASNIKKEIDGYSDEYLLRINTEEAVGTIFEKHKIVLPYLLKEKTTSSITSERVPGYNLPAGTPFVPGRIYEIEIANYRIPFAGDSNIFETTPTQYSGWSENVEINNNTLLLQITNWSKINGDEKVIEKIKEVLLQWVNKIEEALLAAKTDVQKFHTSIRQEIIEYLEKRINLAKTMNVSIDKLNPFK